MPLGNLPEEAKKIWERVYREARRNGDSQATAAKKAWGAVAQAGWRKQKDGTWVKEAVSRNNPDGQKSDALANEMNGLVEFSLYITKASIDNGVMRWAAVSSDTEYDLYGERMSLELYRDFLKYVSGEKQLAQPYQEMFYSDYWRGGMPYVSIAHYPDLNGKAVPGEVQQVYIDGNKLKARGILYDTPLGIAVYRSLQEDKNKKPEEKIRISIGFIDLGHKHGEGGAIWTRISPYSICPQCMNGEGGKIYVNGSLVHLALTRVPVNQRTEIQLEKSEAFEEKADMARKTRKEDAASIIGEEEAQKIEEAQRAMKSRSLTEEEVRQNVMIEMSDVEDETKELVAESEAELEKPEKTNETITPAPVYTKSDTTDNAAANDDGGGGANAPSAPDISDIHDIPENWIAEIREAITAGMQAELDKLENIKSEIQEIQKSLSAFTAQSQAPVAQHDLQPAIDALLQKVDNSIGLPDVEKANILNPALQELGEAITTYIQQKQLERKSAASADDAQDTENQEDNSRAIKSKILDELKQLVQPIASELKSLNERIGMLEAKSTVAQPVTGSRIPERRTYTVSPQMPQMQQIREQVASTQTQNAKPPSLREIVRKSVGIQ
jgi:predicted P-loop ATPase/GTPase